MPLPAPFDRLRLPLIGSPLFIVSGPELVIAQCKAGIIGSFPALNARPQSQLDEWLHQITEELAAHNRAHPDRPAAPYAVNQIVHKTNDRVDADMATCEKWQVPMVITSLGAREDIYTAVRNWGGVTTSLARWSKALTASPSVSTRPTPAAFASARIDSTCAGSHTNKAGWESRMK